MCGIAGVWGSTPLGEDRTRACLESMRHRGPDDHASQSFESPRGHSTTLLFSRLSIIDLDHRANQPMHSHGVWVTLNGEIYNYREVRTVLEGRGVPFRTTSDTEVLLDALKALENLVALACSH